MWEALLTRYDRLPDGGQIAVAVLVPSLVALLSFLLLRSTLRHLVALFHGWPQRPNPEPPRYELYDCQHPQNVSETCWLRGGCRSNGECQRVMALFQPPTPLTVLTAHNTRSEDTDDAVHS